MYDPESRSQVALAKNQSALKVLHALLVDAVGAFPGALSSVALPSTLDTFRKRYPEVLPRFEAARLASPERDRISRHIVTALGQYIVWSDGSIERPLHVSLKDKTVPLTLVEHRFTGRPGWQPSLVFKGARWDIAQLGEFGEMLAEANVVTPQVAEAFAWVGQHLLEDDFIRLSGRRIAMLGAGAEMAPTRSWLEAGADVLWLDTQPPPKNWWGSSDMSGRLFWPADNADLLKRPHEVLATLIAFADGRPLDLGLYAYAPGQARELRLVASMNALVNAMPPELVASATLLVSPTTPTALSVQDRAAMSVRADTRPFWETLCAGLGLLGGGSVSVEDAIATRTVVSTQGASYQAAQYLGKILMAECWASHGQLGTLQATPLRVSANTAAITRTRSLTHPVFAAAFIGAGVFGVDTLSPEQSRCLNGLLSLHDWMHPEMPVPGKTRVHGGIHTLPYPLEPALRIAAAIGFARSPNLLKGLVSNR